MKNIELLGIHQQLPQLRGLKGVKFCYAVNRNKDRIEKEVKRLQESAKASEEFEAYLKENRELFTEHAIKDSNGDPKVFEENGRQINRISEDDMPKYEERHAELKEKFADAIAEREVQVKEYNELLDSEVSPEFEFYKVKMENVPEEISCEQMEIIMPFLEDEG